MSVSIGVKVVDPSGHKGHVQRVSSCGRYAIVVWSDGGHSSHPVGDVEAWLRKSSIRRAVGLKRS